MTFKQRADLPPGGDAAFGGELPQSRLQEEDGDPASKQEDEIRDEESTWYKSTDVKEGDNSDAVKQWSSKSSKCRISLLVVFCASSYFFDTYKNEM